MFLGYDTFKAHVRSLGLPAVRGEEDYVARIVDQPLTPEQYTDLLPIAKHLGVTDEFKEVVDLDADMQMFTEMLVRIGNLQQMQ